MITSQSGNTPKGQDTNESIITDCSESQESVLNSESHNPCVACCELRNKETKQTATEFQNKSIEHTCKITRSFQNDSMSSIQEKTSRTSEVWHNGIDRNVVWNRRLGIKRSISCEPAICGERSIQGSHDKDDEYSEELVNSRVR